MANASTKTPDEKKLDIDLGTFTVDVKMLTKGNFDVYIGHEGCSGEHYPEVTASRIGELVTDLIECVAESIRKMRDRSPDRLWQNGNPHKVSPAGGKR